MIRNSLFEIEEGVFAGTGEINTCQGPRAVRIQCFSTCRLGCCFGNESLIFDSRILVGVFLNFKGVCS